MIPFDFEYYLPETAEEAFACYARLSRAGKAPVWYAGGTELISMARVGSLAFGAVVDLKAVPDCTRLDTERGRLHLGACLTLTQAAESGRFPLLGRTAARIADHTVQDKLTLGGNLAGTIQYREAALPLLLCNARAQVMTSKGRSERPFAQVFPGRLTLGEGEFLLWVDVPEHETGLPYCHAKRTKLDKIDYPLVTLCAVRDGHTVRAAVTGYGDAPLLLPGEVLNGAGLDRDARCARACRAVAELGRDSLSGSRAYKDFVLRTMVEQALADLEVA